MRGATAPDIAPAGPPENFNPRTPCGVRRTDEDDVVFGYQISIHAPHAGCDTGKATAILTAGISIHAPHAGCDAPGNGTSALLVRFQSTHPMRGATYP